MTPVLVHSAAPDAWAGFWLDFLFSPGAAAVAALIAAIIAFLAASRTARVGRRTAREDQAQREQANLREQWWRATMWAADHSISGQHREATLGYHALQALLTSPTSRVDAEQIAFVRALTDAALSEAGILSETAARDSDERKLEHRRITIPTGQLSYPASVYVAAAATRVTSNTLLGHPSPEKLLRLASGDTTVLDEKVAPVDGEPTGAEG